MKLVPTLLGASALCLGLNALAQDSTIRKTLAERIPQLQQIDEVRPTPMKGLYEVRIGDDVLYTDAEGNPTPLPDTEAIRHWRELTKHNARQ